MGNRSENQLDAMLRSVKRRRWQSLVLLCLAVLVAVGVAGIFHHPAIAKTYQVTELTCTAVPPEGAACADYFVHIHNDDCFDASGNLVCPLPEIRPHRHTSDCYSTTRELICTIPESDGHQHTADCYTRVQGELICTLSTEPVLDEEGNVLEEGHVHTDECFAWTEELSCGMEEGQGAHHHDENCYVTSTTLTCAEPEILLHTHTDDCYQKNEDGSIYVDEDGNTWLICGQLQVLEHVHGPECFTTYELNNGEADSTENTEGDESGFVFLFPEEEEEEGQPAESANPETNAADSETDTQTDNTAADADKANESENAESTGDSDSTNDTKVNAEGENQEIASGEAAPIAEAPHEVVYTGTRGAEKGGITVLAEIPEGALDENVQLVLADADESAARKQILKLVNENAAEGEVREISSMLLTDISFVSGGEPAVLQGADPIRITVRAAVIRGMNAPKLFHLSGGTAQEVKDVLFDTEAGSVVFTSMTFSPFAIVDLTGEETAEEAAGVSMPAQNFTGGTDSVIVTVEAPEGAFPAGTTMVVSPVEMDDETLSNVTGAVESSGEKKVVTAQAVDISFFDAEGNLIEPKLPIKVSMKSALVSGSENVALVHLAETGAAETVETETPEVPAATTAEVVADVQVVENPDEDNEIQFESDAFSVYVLVGTETITTNYITADGETYTITVTYGPEAMIPAEATLAVAEIPRDSEEYASYLAQAQSAVKAGANTGGTEAVGEPADATEDAADPPEEPGNAAETENAESTGGTVDRVSVTTARFFDITILDAAGNPVEPAAPVDVKIEYMEPAETAENYQVVHFGEETEVLNPAVSGADGAASAFDFQASSFSVYGIVGTKIITMQYITANGETYIITVTYGEEAGIPEGAELNTFEITDGEAYAEYLLKAAELMNGSQFDFSRIFDIKIVSQGEIVEPSAAVSVRIDYIDGNHPEEAENIQVIHFSETESEVLSAEASIVPEGYMELQFSTESFSAFATVKEIVGEENILAYLSFENTSADESGNHSGVTVHGSGQYADGISGKAWYMDGNGNGWLSLNNSAGGSLLGSATTATVSYWARPTRTGTSWAYYSAPNGKAQTYQQEYYIGSFTNGSVLNAERYCNGRNNGSATAAVDTDEWNFYTIVYDNTATTVYINGEQKRVMSGQHTLQEILGSNSIFQVGKANWGNGEYFQGYIDEFSVFGKALPITEVQALYEEAYKKTLSHWATRISVTDLVEKNIIANPIPNVVIYTRVWNESKNNYDYYAVAADGSLVPVYDVSDTIGWRVNADLEWKLTVYTSAGKPNGYFELQNSQGKYLAPQLSDSTAILSDNTLGLRFEGWETGTTGTSLEGWDTTAYAYSGLKIEDGKLVAAGENESIEFFFALTDSPQEIGKLETVATVDTRDTIHISMYDFPSREMMRDIMGTDAYSSGHTAQFGLVRDLLANDTKIPQLFNDTYKVRENVSNLFLQGVYDESGYYYYNASDNYAYLPDESKDFIVYKQTATYQDVITGTAEQHGNFFPYNKLDANVVGLLRELYDVGDTPLTPEDPRYEELMYLASNINYYFGMKLDTDFTFPKDGKDKNGNAVVYEFTGDDDLWVYIDDVLVLDIGGIHGAINGSINFATGEVHVYSNNSESNYPNALDHKDTTIRAMFQEAGYSEEWLNAHFDGDTFKDYSVHNMKMFYMERGANASNLRIRFNLPVVEKGSFTVSKELDEGQADYANMAFSYYAYYMDAGVAKPIVPDYTNPEAVCTGAYYVNADGTTGTQTLEVNENGRFSLKPGQRARFQMKDSSLAYYVKEVDIDPEKIVKVTINGTETDVAEGTASSTTETIAERGEVNFVNTPSENILDKLYITKELETDVEDPLTKFEFYVYLENTDGNIVPYNRGVYYIMKDGKYYHFENSYPVPDGDGVERTAYRSGPYGTISDIPGGFTAVIEDLVAGTHFIVIERTWNNLPIRDSSNYVFIDKTVDEASVNAITMIDEQYDIDGAITESTVGVSQVVIKNRPIYRLSAKKVWGGSIVGEGDTHGTVAVALYKKATDGSSLTLVSNSLRYIEAPNTTVDYFIPDENLENYVIREVTVSGTEESLTITPIEAGKTIVIEDETVDGKTVDDTYIVSYTPGEKTVKLESYYSDGEEKAYYVERTETGKNTVVEHQLTVREDTITNTMPKLTVNKKSMDGSQLADAEFKLTGADGETALTGYDKLKSSDKASGNLLDGIYLSNGTYYLVETKAPDGFNMLTYKVKIVVSEDNKIFTASTVPESTTLISNLTPDNNMLYTFDVYNNPGVELPQTGGEGTLIFSVLGTILILSSTLMILAKRKQEAYTPRH